MTTVASGVSISLKVFLAVFCISLIVHIAMLIMPQSETPRQKQVGSDSESTYLVMYPQIDETYENISWTDPTLFLLPSDYGFSSKMRRMIPSGTREYGFSSDVRGFSGAIRREDFASPAVFIQPLQANRWTEELTVEDVLSGMNTVSVQLERARKNDSETAEEKSTWQVFGFANLISLNPDLALPKVSSTEISGPTVLRIGVMATGDVQYVVIEKSSNSDKADGVAIRFARTLRFSPSEDVEHPSISWGFVKIFWSLEAPPVRL